MAATEVTIELDKTAQNASSVLAKLNEFSLAYPQVQIPRVVSGSLELVASLATCIKEELEQYHDKIPVQQEFLVDILRICEVCRKNMDAIQVIIDAGVKGESKSFLTPEVQENLRELREGRARLFVSHDAIKYLALRKGYKEKTLSAADVLELERLRDQLPWIHQHLQSFPSKIKDILEQPTAENQGEPIKMVEIRDDDARSIASVDSLRRSDFINISEIYECWTIRKSPTPYSPPKYWTIFGIRIMESVAGGDFYEIVPQKRTQEELKEHIEEFTKPGKTSHIKRIMSEMPRLVQEEVDLLVEDRINYSSNRLYQRRWQVVDIQASQAVTTGVLWMKKKDTSCQEWDIIIKGEETAEPVPSERPNRMSDPWRKPGTRRDYSPRGIHDLHQRVRGARRSRGLELPEQPLSQEDMGRDIEAMLIGKTETQNAL